jgi:hypothetical protein
MSRAATERLIRRFLEATEAASSSSSSSSSSSNSRRTSSEKSRQDPQAAILYLDVHRALDKVPDTTTFSFGSEVYHPVCRAYGVPVVSVRDAVWPVKDAPRPELWDTKAGAHPLWSGHQLITDLLAFTWISASNRSLWGFSTQQLKAQTHASPLASALAPRKELPQAATGTVLGAPYIFGSSGNHEADVCPDGKYLSAPPSSVDWLKPSRSDTKGWQMVDYNGKLGWEYSLVEESKKRRHLQYLGDAFNITWFTHRQLKALSKTISLKSRKRYSGGKQNSTPRLELPPALLITNTSELQEIQDLRQAYIYATKEIKTDKVQFLEIVRSPLAKALALLDGEMLTDGERLSHHNASVLRELCYAIVLEHIYRNPLPSVPPKILKNLPGIISFPGRFKASSPGLLVEYLRSYANYGQAIVFVTANSKDPHLEGNAMTNESASSEEATTRKPSYDELESRARDMLRLAWIDHRFITQCKQALNEESNHKGSKFTNYRYVALIFNILEFRCCCVCG